MNLNIYQRSVISFFLCSFLPFKPITLCTRVLFLFLFPALSTTHCSAVSAAGVLVNALYFSHFFSLHQIKSNQTRLLSLFIVVHCAAEPRRFRPLLLFSFFLLYLICLDE